MARRPVDAILAWAVLLLAALPLGASVFVLGFVLGDSPCILCWGQRTGMALIALVGLFILRYGPRPRYVGTGVLLGAYGLYMAARHSSLHLARDIGQGFSAELFGAHTYTWSLLVYWVCVVTMGVLLLLLRDGEATREARELTPLGRTAAVVFLVTIAATVVQAFAGSGPPPFVGPGDPVRFSFDPRHWGWTMEEWKGAPISLRGRWAISKPGLDGVDADPASGPLAGLPSLAVSSERTLSLPLEGRPDDLAYDAASDRFLLTTDAHGVYLLDGALSRILRYTVIDPAYSVDMGQGLPGAAFVDATTVAALAENKSFVVLRESDAADAGKNFRYFLKSFDRFEELARGRFATVRARLMYVSSLAYDPEHDSFWTVAVPNETQRQLVVSRFDRRDMTLSEEFVPVLAPDSGLALAGEKRSLAEYHVTGLTYADGRLWALSAAHSTLLEIDPKRRAIAAAWTIPGLDRPTGLAARSGDLVILGQDGGIWTVARPGS
ncbi:MAG: disulfide bond formation protein B [Thermoanaerobaculia bacterium]|nr:MAG: disulfide bond formation protein B [Thermoanaerobaculia bacterium]